MRKNYPLLIGNRSCGGAGELPVRDKYRGAIAAQAAFADRAQVEAALAAALAGFSQTRRLATDQRRDVLLHVVRRLDERRAEFVETLVVEAGKPIRDARSEVGRAIETFRTAAEECSRIGGHYQQLDISERTRGYEGVWKRVPIGPCLFITPFNFPLNLVAHKVAPAIAAGCSWILKPASATPLSALLLGEILAETMLPAGAFSVVPCRAADAEWLAGQDALRMLSFTGSPEVGWRLRERAGRKRVALELGGNAACIVDRDADLAYAAERITFGAFYQSGQSCISVQRVLAHRDVYDELRARLLALAGGLRSGDPADEQTFLGPLIDVDAAERVERWIAEAVAGGGRVLCGGKRDGALLDATWLEHVPPAAKLNCEEVFGPVATLTPVENFNQALALANDSAYGLQCGVFTRSLEHAMLAFDTLEVGGVIINDSPAFRVDSMPYGGVKHSGLGREGVRFAIEEMTEVRLLVLNRSRERGMGA